MQSSIKPLQQNLHKIHRFTIHIHNELNHGKSDIRQTAILKQQQNLGLKSMASAIYHIYIKNKKKHNEKQKDPNFREIANKKKILPRSKLTPKPHFNNIKIQNLG